jgi:hypothetical protein
MDWINYRTLRNNCTKLVKRSKCDYYLNMINENINDPSSFWKLTKSVSGQKTFTSLPDYLKLNESIIKDKENIVNAFNKHFISGGETHNCSNLRKQENVEATSCYITQSQQFNFIPILATQVHKVLSNLDIKKSAGPDKIEPYFLKISAHLITEPITSIFNLSLTSNVIPRAWKSASVLPLLKAGDPSVLDNYRPISRLSVLAKVFESCQ